MSVPLWIANAKEVRLGREAIRTLWADFFVPLVLFTPRFHPVARPVFSHANVHMPELLTKFNLFWNNNSHRFFVPLHVRETPEEKNNTLQAKIFSSPSSRSAFHFDRQKLCFAAQSWEIVVFFSWDQRTTSWWSPHSPGLAVVSHLYQARNSGEEGEAHPAKILPPPPEKMYGT